MNDETGLIDLVRYPVTEPASATLLAQVRRLREALQTTGAAEAPGFLSQAGLASCVADAAQLASLRYNSVGTGSAYLEEPAPHWLADHPRGMRGRYSVGVVAYDQFPPASPIRRLYESAFVMAFIAAVLQRKALYRYADPMGALNLAVMGEGDELQWHFDQTDFVVSLALRDAETGGDFEVAPKIRDAQSENYAAVSDVLDGSSSGVTRLPMTPGTLLIFAGRNSLHRVSPIAGATTRLVALFGYDTRPDTRSSPHLQLKRYGRTA